MGDDSARTLRSKLEHGAAAPAEVVGLLAVAALDAPTRAARLDACELLGELAGRALGAEWDVAERAAFALLEAARVADMAADRRGEIAAMGRGFRNIWLLPFVHRRLSDRDPTIAAAALDAAGGLGVPAREEAVAAYLGDGVPRDRRLAAIGALGRMGAASAGERLVPLVMGDPIEAAAALGALTEIRSPAGRAAALEVLDRELEPEVQIAAVRYLAELGALEVLLVLAGRSDLPAHVRVRAIGAIEADQAWERDALVEVARGDGDEALRAAAVQAIGAFATTSELIERIGELAKSPSAAVRGAVLWALQLAREERDAAAKLVEPMLDDADPAVRRRAAYVAGNLG